VPALLDAIDHLIEANAALRKTRALAGPERRLERAMRRAFLAEQRAFLTRLAKLKSRFAPTVREVAEYADWEPLFSDAALETLQAFVAPIDEFTAKALLAGMLGAVADLDIETSFTLEHPEAVNYLRNHGANQVTRIRETTREQLRTILTQAANEGWSYDKTAKAIRQRYRHFGKERARNIAIYELGDGYEAGNLVVAKDLQAGGLEMQKSWLPAANPCPICQGNAAESWIPLDQAFSGGSDRAPGHVRCRCSTLFRRKPNSEQ